MLKNYLKTAWRSLLVTVSYQALRAASRNPVNSLRAE
jgi:hypothetical protein